MSEYLRVLSRLEREAQNSPAPRPPAARPALAAVPSDVAARVLRAAVLDARGAAFAGLYDSVRAAVSRDGTVALVIAGAAADAAPGPVIDGLAQHVRRLGQRVTIAEVAEPAGLPVLRLRPDATQPQRGPAATLPLELRNHTSAEHVRDWLAGVVDTDLILIDGGALEHSIDAALLACGCDGLVIVVRTEATARDALRLAAERARAVGCRTLGLVVEMQPERLPPWQRRAPYRPIRS